MNIAVYAGTFDPITLGHVDLIQRAAKIFDQIIIAIAASPAKQPLFNLKERIDLAERSLQASEKVKVFGFSGLLLDFAKEQGATVIIRGLRTVTDFDYEFQLASMNRHMNPSIESLFLMPSEKYMTISASLVREIASLKGDVANFVPEPVLVALQQKFS